jgi:hypothetical protein
MRKKLVINGGQKTNGKGIERERVKKLEKSSISSH